MASEGPERPPWAASLDDSSLRRVKNLVGQELRARSLEFHFMESGVEWVGPDEWPHPVSLKPLADRLAQSDPAEWSELIAREMDGLLAGDDPPTLLGDAVDPGGGERSRAAPLLDRVPHRDRSSDPALSESAPPGGIRSPFAKRTESAPSSPPTEVTEGTWEETEERAPPAASPPFEGAPPPPRASERSAPEPELDWKKKWAMWLVFAGLALTAVLEVVGYLSGPDALPLWAGAQNDLLLESVPQGAAVLAELDGRHLGTTPLRFLVPEGTEPKVLIASPGRQPQRVTLPTKQERLVVRLEPEHPLAPECQVETRSVGEYRFRRLFQARDEAEGPVLDIRGAEIITTLPEGKGAWLVECPKGGGKLEETFVRAQPPLIEVQIDRPTGGYIYLDERPLGRVPNRFAYSGAFMKLTVQSNDAIYRTRWIPVPQSIAVEMPILDSSVPMPSIAGGQLEDPRPVHLRPRQKERTPGLLYEDVE